MKRNRLFRSIALALFVIYIVTVFRPAAILSQATSDKVNISLVGKYDSADTAAIRAIDLDKKEIRFRNHSTGKTYTLSYDNTSMIYDVRGVALSAALLEVGQIVDVTFLKSSKHITTLNVSGDAWVVDNTRDHDLVRGDGTARVKGELYKIDPRTLVMADGELALAEDVLSTDHVRVSGIGKDIYSVIVTSGHGYVSLSSDTVEDHSLVGAWFELDNEVIYKISPNMLLSAPEGSYNLQILGNGANYQSEVDISRNQETVVDTSNVTITKPKEGLVTFNITPDTAEVFVDGEKVLTGVPQSIKYGYHSLKIMADGYVTQTRYLKVGTPNSVVTIELEKDEASSSKSSSDDESSASVGSIPDSSSEKKSVGVSTGDINANKEETTAEAASTASTVSENSSSETTENKVIKGHKIYIDTPYGAEFYFDGNYIGMVPASVTKISGTHEVILKQDGYETKSYRIKIDAEETDLTYTFPDLKKIKKEEEESSSDAATDSTTKDDSPSEATTDDPSKDTTDDSPTDGSTDGTTEDPSGEGDSSDSGDTTPTDPSEDSSDDHSGGGSTDAIPSGETTTTEPGESTSGDSSEEGDETEEPGENNTNKTGEDAGDAANTASGED